MDADLFQKHKQGPCSGREMRGGIPTAPVRGSVVFDGEKVVAQPAGRLVRPAD